MALADSTLLTLSKVGGGFTLSAEYSARGITMTMEPADGVADIRRDVNRNLVNLHEGVSAFLKYKFTLACDDQDSPGFAASSGPLSPGDRCTLVCIEHLGDASQQTYTVMVMQPGWQIQRDEWGAAVSWSIELEQV